MRGRGRGAVGVVAVAGGVLACSGEGARLLVPVDAGRADAGQSLVFDGGGAAHLEAGPLDARAPVDRLSKHANMVLGAMHLRAIYVTNDDGSGASPSFDDVLGWALTKDGYWSFLAQYGVGGGAYDGASTVSLGAVVPASSIVNGVVAAADFAAGLRALLQASRVDGGARDASAQADGAYIVFLPDGLNVTFPDAKVTTCVDIGAFHDYDGDEPYAVIPPCATGRSSVAVSHELAEMATDPAPGFGWYSDGDASSPNGDEIADICAGTTATVDGFAVARLWSNAYRACVP